MNQNKQNLKLNAEKIVSAGLKALNPNQIIAKINFDKFRLHQYKKIYLIGAGKGSSAIVTEIEKQLNSDQLTNLTGLVIDTNNHQSSSLETIIGTHPLPSETNVAATQKIIKLLKQTTNNDLVLCVICGGTSALLTDPVNSITKTKNIYDQLLKCGASIHEINIVRRHIDKIKGGGLAKLANPATVISLIISDVPGDDLISIGSGPTVYDPSTVADAQVILDKYQIDSNVKLSETEKDKTYFKHVNNQIIADNNLAMQAMASAAKSLGYNTKIGSDKINNYANQAAKHLITDCQHNSAYICAGEIKLKINSDHGQGGRCTHLAAEVLKNMDKNMAFAAIASDGLDNTDAAGAIVDIQTLMKIKKSNLELNNYLEKFDTYNLFKQTEDLYFTGPLAVNVSDLYLVLKN